MTSYLKNAALSLVLLGAATALNAQTSQNAQGSKNAQIDGNNNFVNSGQISIIINQQVQQATTEEQKEALRNLSAMLSLLSNSGELQLSESAVKVLAQGAIASLARQPIKRDIITERQFKIPYQKTHNIAGTNNRITYTRNNCGGNYGVSFTFNRESTCVFTGGTYTFTEQGQKFDLVFDGYTDNSANFAQFTIYPHK